MNNNKKSNLFLLGALAGDIIGSVHEYNAPKTTEFPLFTPRNHFTDDSILTLAVAEAIVSGRTYLECIREYALANPHGGYGGYFQNWMYSDDPQPYNSFGNGSAMRVSAVGWMFNSVEDVLNQAEASAVVTHNHPEGIKGAQAVALAIYRARTGASKDDIRRETCERFSYDLSATLDEIRPTYRFDETCQKTVPPAIIAFLEAKDFEDSVRLAISLGGDADTLAAITGSIAEAYYGGVPQAMAEEVQNRLTKQLWKTVLGFNQHVGKLNPSILIQGVNP